MFVARRFKNQLLDGDIAALYLIVYSLIRFFTEFQRPDAWTFSGVPVAQIVSATLLVGAVAVVVIRRLVLHQQPVPQPVDAEAEPPEPASPVRRRARRSKPRSQ